MATGASVLDAKLTAEREKARKSEWPSSVWHWSIGFIYAGAHLGIRPGADSFERSDALRVARELRCWSRWASSL